MRFVENGTSDVIRVPLQGTSMREEATRPIKPVLHLYHIIHCMVAKVDGCFSVL